MWDTVLDRRWFSRFASPLPPTLQGSDSHSAKQSASLSHSARHCTAPTHCTLHITHCTPPHSLNCSDTQHSWGCHSALQWGEEYIEKQPKPPSSRVDRGGWLGKVKSAAKVKLPEGPTLRNQLQQALILQSDHLFDSSETNQSQLKIERVGVALVKHWILIDCCQTQESNQNEI